jgi:hypothetical protein
MADDLFKKLQPHETGLQQIFWELYSSQSIFAEQERLARVVNPLHAIVEDIARTTRPFEQALVASSISDQIAQVAARGLAVSQLAKESRNSLIESVAAFQESISHSNIMEAIERYSMETETVSRALAAMRSPLMGFQNQLQSIAALTELHGIGQILATMPSFGDTVASALRVDLGDWRKPLAVDYAALLDPIVRSEFYVERGFDPNLTAFPASAFREGMTSAGLYDSEQPEDEDDLEEDAEAAFMRTNEAHDRLMRFEHSIRRVINEAMTLAFGPDWIKHRVPEPIRVAWTEKRNRGLSDGQVDLPLIEYADLTDYAPIITRKDNWRDVFGAIFTHKPSVEESFRRLYPVRNCTMHARLITQDDALFLLVEIKRLSKAMGFGL